MTAPINVQMTPQGLLIPRQAIRRWLKQGVDVLWEKGRIVIQPKSVSVTEYDRILCLLEMGGLLMPAESLPRGHKPVRRKEQARLAMKLSEGRPLYQVVIEEHEERA